MAFGSFKIITTIEYATSKDVQMPLFTCFTELQKFSDGLSIVTNFLQIGNSTEVFMFWYWPEEIKSPSLPSWKLQQQWLQVKIGCT